MSHILIVDDEPSICWALDRALGDDGHRVTTAASAEEALDFTQNGRPDVVVMDVRLPGMDGLAALEQLREHLHDVPVIIITAFGDLESAVQAIHRGAFEYLTKPFDLDDAIHVIRRALESAEPSVKEADVPPELGAEGTLLGESPAMQAVFRQIALVTRHDVPVLISGESGTGKELVATVIHRYSRRADGPFIPICVPAMNESVVESELFGHAKGAFTGAAFAREGLLAASCGGTAFFDEIGDIVLGTQVKLLRALETKSFMPVGTSETRRADFRLVAATNQRLERKVAEGAFREDLLYRLNVFHIELPPLRERRDDIPVLARRFLQGIAARRESTFTSETLTELMSRPWHGNVRELRNAVEHAVIVARSAAIGPECLPPPMAKNRDLPSPGLSLRKAVREWLSEKHAAAPDTQSGLFDAFLEEVEPVVLGETLEIAGGNRTEAARLLGIHRQTLRDKLRRHGLNSAD